MAELQDLRKQIAGQFPEILFGLAYSPPKPVEVCYVNPVSEADQAAIAGIVAAFDFDFDAPKPNIAGFFESLGQAIATKQLPPEVYVSALILKDQTNPAIQKQLMTAMATDPAYTDDQRKHLDLLVAAHHLGLPEVATKE